MSVELRCSKHPKRKYLSAPKVGSCPACEDIFHLIREKAELTSCWAVLIVLPGGTEV